MDPHSFDRLVRSLGSRGHGRRTLVRAVGGGVFGAVLGGRLGAAPPATAARCTELGRRCQAGDRCCGGGRCQGGRCRCASDAACRGGEYCHNGECRDRRRFGERCDRDAECQTGVCDQYQGRCLENRFGCNPNREDACRQGVCCGEFPNDKTSGQCVYQNATPHELLEGCLLCGACAAGQHALCCPPTRCQDGACCCPPGVPAAQCLSNGQPVPLCP